ncbi:MAG TPA: hypothetical protein VF463_13090 [Sphingobium sp.]
MVLAALIANAGLIDNNPGEDRRVDTGMGVVQGLQLVIPRLPVRHVLGRHTSAG